MDLLTGFAAGSFGNGQGIDRESVAGIVADRDEPDILSVIGDHLERDVLCPFFGESLFRDAIIADRITEGGEFVEGRLVVFAPGEALLQFLLLFGEPGADLGEPLFQREGLRSGILRPHRKRCDEREVGGTEVCCGFAEAFGLAEQRGGTIVHRLEGSRNVNHAKLLQISEELVFFPSRENEVVTGHFLYHDCSSSSSAACLPLTILEDALERFSSSSMYRLILRMASL